jgi:hypothetical protein
MAKSKEVTLYQLIGAKYVCLTESENGKWDHTPGATFYLRFIRDGKRAWQAVGKELRYALDEMKARQSYLANFNAPFPLRMVIFS